MKRHSHATPRITNSWRNESAASSLRADLSHVFADRKILPSRRLPSERASERRASERTLSESKRCNAPHRLCSGCLRSRVCACVRVLYDGFSAAGINYRATVYRNKLVPGCSGQSHRTRCRNEKDRGFSTFPPSRPLASPSPSPPRHRWSLSSEFAQSLNTTKPGV